MATFVLSSFVNSVRVVYSEDYRVAINVDHGSLLSHLGRKICSIHLVKCHVILLIEWFQDPAVPSHYILVSRVIHIVTLGLSYLSKHLVDLVFFGLGFPLAAQVVPDEVAVTLFYIFAQVTFYIISSANFNMWRLYLYCHSVAFLYFFLWTSKIVIELVASTLLLGYLG